jgi:hypothetical protein
MLISSNRPAISNSNFVRPQANPESVTYLAPGDVYVPSEPNVVSSTASGAALGTLVGAGGAALLNNLTGGFGGAALAVGLVIAGGVGGGFLGKSLFEASQK